MHVILMLVLITADGPTQKAFEQPSIEKCWESAHDIMGKMEGDGGKMALAGFTGYGAGCVVVSDPTQESGG